MQQQHGIRPQKYIGGQQARNITRISYDATLYNDYHKYVSENHSDNVEDAKTVLYAKPIII